MHDSTVRRKGALQDRPRRVIKLGGSLLTRPSLLRDLEHWFANAPPAIDLVVVGGGELIDAIRNLDAIRPGNAAATHWRCVALLEFTFEIVRSWFPEWNVIESPDVFESPRAFESQLHERLAPSVPTLVSVGAYYRAGIESELPEDWRTTTDAIAALLAAQVEARTLVLLKSCEVDPAASIEQLADQGVIDQAFPLLARRIPEVEVVTLASSR